MSVRSVSLVQAVELVKAGRSLIYPTETFYALGCSCFAGPALDVVLSAKGRPMGKPMPVIIGSSDQLGQVAAPLSPVLEKTLAMMRSFWPGPLSVAVQAKPGLPAPVVSSGGLVAVRVTSHPEAARLCRMAGVPLAASSANLSGRPPCAQPHELSHQLMELAGGVLFGDIPPSGGQPSTLVRPDRETPGLVHVLRPGAVSREQLEEAGLSVVTEGKAVP